MEGDNITVSCNGSGSPLPDVDWGVNGLHSINTHQVNASYLLHVCKCICMFIFTQLYYFSPLFSVKCLLAEHPFHQPYSCQRESGRQRLRTDLHLRECGWHGEYFSSAGSAM